MELTGAQKLAAGGVAIVAVVLAVFIGVWQLDERAHRGRVPRNVMFLNENFGGLDVASTRNKVANLAESFDSFPVQVSTPKGMIDMDAGELGLQLDQEGAVERIFAARDDEPRWLGPFNWAASWISVAQVGAVGRFDINSADAALAELAEQIDTAPGDHTMTLEAGRLVPVEGEPGQALEADRFLARLEANLPASTQGAIIIEAPVTEVPPPVSVSDLTRFVDDLNSKTIIPLPVRVGGESEAFTSNDVRSWLRLVNNDDGTIEAGIEADLAQAAIEERFAGLKTDVDLTELVVFDGSLSLGDGAPKYCCRPVAKPILAAIVNNEAVAEIDMESEGDELLEEIGIADLVGEFTTEHAPDQNRVVNIQRMADIVRGAMIEPGQMFSINEHVGRRTEENGFVSDGVIYNGVLTQDIGGGVSQFATTIFNAAFFAGLEFGEYQSHSLYFDRYPRGREATISFPNPDLQIMNQTSYPVFIWTSYTDESITVQLFSTQHIDTEETGTYESPAGYCTRVTTERTRTFEDGRKQVDAVEALYQPREGINCQGESTVPAPNCGAGQAAYDSDGDGFDDACRSSGRTAVCPAGYSPVDTTGDGAIDTCLLG